MSLTDAIVKVSVPTPFPVGDVNVYIIKREPLTLIDAGPLTEKAMAIIADSLSTLGHQIQDIEQIILTHGHVDHFGLVRRLKKESGAKVYINPKDNSNVTEFPEEQKRKNREGLSKSGVPLIIMENTVNFIRDYGEPVEVDGYLLNNDVLRFNNIVFKVIHTPGHSPGSICLFEETKGILISGDTILQEITTNAISIAKEERGELATYLKTLKMLTELPVNIVLPGHGDNFSNHKLVVKNYMKQYLKRKQKVLRSISVHPKNAYQIMIDIFGQLMGMNVFLGMSEVLGHLDILINEGHVTSHEDENQIIYKIKGK